MEYYKPKKKDPFYSPSINLYSNPSETKVQFDGLKEMRSLLKSAQTEEEDKAWANYLKQCEKKNERIRRQKVLDRLNAEGL